MIVLLPQTKGPSIYYVHTEGEGVRLRWTGEVQPHVDVHKGDEGLAHVDRGRGVKNLILLWTS